jgi:signal transduction histidine kinase
MKTNTQKIKNIFIRKMIFSSISQLIVMIFLIFFIRNYIVDNQTNSISDNLLIKDQYTRDQIGSYYLLGSNYAMDMELHNLGDMRKLDSIMFFSKAEDEYKHHNCVLRANQKFKLCKADLNEYVGVSAVLLNNKKLGYVLMKKKYSPISFAPISQDLFAIFVTVMGIFILNFWLLFLPIKKKIESNTKLLLNLISAAPNRNNILPRINIDEYKIIAQKFIDERNETTSLQNEKMYYQVRKALSEQVAHDIRSPLAALSIFTGQDFSLPEQSRILLRNIINRIRDIANDLVERNRGQSELVNSVDADLSVQLLAAVICPLVTEKRLQFGFDSQIDIEFELSSINYGLFAKINLTEFKRMLSNLINNANEALPNKGKISIKTLDYEESIRLIISDNGKGIPVNILEKLGSAGISYDKKVGSGLGLYHSIKTVEQLGGKLQLISELGKGTDVILTIPRSDTPAWFLPKLEIYSGTTLVIVDDDFSIHEMWHEIFKKYKAGINFIKLDNPSQFHKWKIISRDMSLPIFYLFDLEFIGDQQTGLNLIQEYQLEKNSILVTNHSDDINIHNTCEKLEIKMIPKDLIVFVPIKIL